MIIEFGTRQLEKLANDSRAAIKKWGSRRQQLYNLRINQLKATPSFDVITNLPGKHHPLTGDRKGQWACNLDAGWRLIYRPIGEKTEVTYQIIRIEEVTDYH